MEEPEEPTHAAYIAHHERVIDKLIRISSMQGEQIGQLVRMNQALADQVRELRARLQRLEAGAGRWRDN